MSEVSLGRMGEHGLMLGLLRNGEAKVVRPGWMQCCDGRVQVFVSRAVGIGTG